MELLILGIDAADERIISVMDMPNLKKILNRNRSYPTNEDLSSRGWAEMLSGKNGRETGAYYAKPKLDGTRECTLNFDTHDYENNPDVIPIWELINNKKKSVGIMNVPTTKYAPKVDGFFVSGAGGGLAGVEGIPEEFCYPKDVAQFLNENGYIIDTRLMSSGIKDMEQWIERLKLTMKKRTECFLGLQKRFQVDIGFIAYIATCRMQYLAMSEIEEIIENRGMASSEIQKKIKELFVYFDNLIGELVDGLSPERVMVVSDHGQSKYLHDVNVNYFLKDIGLWNNADTDKAFGMFYVSGIFLNDNRFEGVVKEEEKESLISFIIEKFNQSAEANRYSMRACEYRNLHKDCKFHELFPDIWIEAPNTVFFLPWTDRFIAENKSYGPLYGLRSVTNEMNSGIKSAKAVMSAPFEYGGISEDLTGVYQIVEKYLDTLQE